MQKTTEPALKREIGAVSLALNAINLTVGSGIFVLPAIVAASLGPSSFIAYIICGVLVILIMLCYAEVGSKIITTGGSYAYVEKAFGPLAGFLVNTLFWVGFSSLADAAVINAMTDMLTAWFPIFSILYVRVILFAAIFGLLAFINIRGVKEGANFAVATTIVKLAPLIALIFVGLFSIVPANLAIKTLPGIKTIGETSLVLFFAFLGTETALTVSGEIKNPQKNIPKGIFMGVAGVLVIYMLLQFVAQGVLGNQLPLQKDAPLAALATHLIGPVGGTVILITGVVSMFGLISGDILASPRMLFAASKDKLLPNFLGRIHPKFATPYWSIIVYSAAGFIFASASDFKKLAELASSSVLFIYLGVVLATLKLQFKKNAIDNGGFKIPGGPIVPVLAVIVIGWFLSHITMAEVKSLSIFFGSLIVFYFVNLEWRKSKGMG
jgi:basic amino acid/polyamine antiporter, APA family